MNNQIVKTETVTYRRTTVTLAQDAQGFWGWAIGNAVMMPMFAYRDSAFGSAKRHIDATK